MAHLPPLPDVPAQLATTPWRDAERLAAALQHLATGPDPDATAARIARLLTAAPGLAARTVTDPTVAAAVVAICGASRALSGTATSLGDDALEPLSWTDVPFPRIELPPEPAAALRRGVARHMLGIAALDLTGRMAMPQVGAALSDLADIAAASALEAIGADGIAVIALGKWGGRELNYASDIDLVFVHEGDTDTAIAAAARFVDLMTHRTGEGIAFRVDADLRPEGAAGPLSRSLGSYVAYWRQWAHTWELQALLKARPAAGDLDLGRAFIAAAEPFVYPERLAPDAIREIRAMKARTESLVADDELKRGIGGIRDIEFAVQLLQLVHGRADPELRSAATLEALAHLGAGGYVREDDASDLGEAYRWLRDVEHRIQLHDLRQTHSVPADPAGRTRLAKVLGYRDSPNSSAVARFDEELRERRRQVRTIHERLFYRPLLEAFARSSTDERSQRQLSALGFTDSDAARAAVRDLTAGLSRRSRLMQQLLPVMMEWLSESPDPDLGLAQLRMMVAGADDNAALVAALRDHPAAAERLCHLLGTARAAGRLVDRIPAALPRLGDDDALAAAPRRDDLIAEALERVRIRGDHPTRVAALHRFWAESLLETISADVAGIADEVAVGHRLTDAADALVAGLLASAVEEVGTPVPPLAVVALGKWGGGELTYAGDLDALVVYGPSHLAGAEAAAARVAELLVGSLATSPLGIPPPPLDLDLRPEGKKGIIARSLASYQAYWERWALTWEHQALLRVRSVAGDDALGAAFITATTPFAHPEHLGEERIREIRAMKVRIEQERIPLAEDPEFHVKLGRGALADVEWTVQLLQMLHGQARPGVRTASTRQGIDALHASGLLTGEDAAILEQAYRFCAAVRNRLFLRAGRTRDSLPADATEAAILARSLGYEVAPRTSLREEYRRVTRRARRVVERVFYGWG